MSTVAASPAPSHPNPHARLELLSNTALLKKVMDSRVTSWTEKLQSMKCIENIVEPKKSTFYGTLSTMDVTESHVKSSSTRNNPTAPQPQQNKVGEVAILPKGTMTKHDDAAGHLSVPVIEKTSTSPAPHVHSTPTTVSPAPSVTIQESQHAPFVGPSSSSYASLLVPPDACTSPPVSALNHHQLLALAHLPPHLKTAMAAACIMNASAASGEGNKIVYGGGPSSAFRKPYGGNLVLLKENVPPSRSAVALTTAVTREDSPPPPNEETSSRESRVTMPLPSEATIQALIEENQRLQQRLQQKDDMIASLKIKADSLEKQIGELRQLPTGKISHIPIEDMIRIMQDYGSEVSNQTLPKRKQPIQKASIVRQFRRWNPEFFRFFVHVNGEWVPRLGREGELKRRAEKRRALQKTKKVDDSPDSAKSH